MSLCQLGSPQEGSPSGGWGETVAKLQSVLSCLHSVTILGDAMVNETNQVPRAVTPPRGDRRCTSKLHGYLRGWPGVQAVSRGQEAADIGEKAALRERILKVSQRSYPSGSDLSNKRNLVRQSRRGSLPGRGHPECKGPEAGGRNQCDIVQEGCVCRGGATSPGLEVWTTDFIPSG